MLILPYHILAYASLTLRIDPTMDIAASEGVIVLESYAGGGASILVRNNDYLFNNVFWAVCIVNILFLIELTLAHIDKLILLRAAYI